MEKNWNLKSQGDAATADRLSTELGITRPLATLLFQRGVNTFDEAKNFFRPELTDLHDPFLMKDMDIAVIRIKTALENKEKILGLRTKTLDKQESSLTEKLESLREQVMKEMKK